MDDRTFHNYANKQIKELRKESESIRKATALIKKQYGIDSPQPSAPSYDGHHNNHHSHHHPDYYDNQQYTQLPNPYLPNGQYIGCYQQQQQQQQQYPNQQPVVLYGEDSGCCIIL